MRYCLNCSKFYETKACETCDTRYGDETTPVRGEQWQDKERSTRQNNPTTLSSTDLSAQAPVQKTFHRLSVSSITDSDDDYENDPLYSEINNDSDNDLKDDEHLYSEINDDYKDEIRIVLVGKTGSGKSATGNTLLGNIYFESKTACESVTRKCEREESEVNGRKIIVVDTPGLFDTYLSPEEIRESIVRCFCFLAPGPHVFLLILQIGRFTKEEIDALNQLFEIFGKSMKRCAILVFTHLDKLERENQSIETFLLGAGKQMKKYIKRCKGRYFAIDNMAVEDKRLKFRKEFISIIDKTVRQNEGKCFSNGIFKIVQSNIAKAVLDGKKQNKEKLLEIEQEFVQTKKTIEERIEIISLQEDQATKFKRRMQYFREMDKMDTDNNYSSLIAEMQKQEIPTNIELQEMYEDVSERLDKIRADKRDAEEFYEKIKQEKHSKVKEIMRKQEMAIVQAIEQIADDTCRAINFIQEQLEKNNIELEKIRNDERKANGNKHLQKEIQQKEKKLIQQKNKMIRRQNKYICKMLRNSNLLQRELTKRNQMCTII